MDSNKPAAIIKYLHEKKLVGMRLEMSLAENRTAELWRTFMPRRKEILNSVGEDLYSLQNYGAGYFRNFNPANKFEKWAAREVSDFSQIPEGMEPFIVPAGKYAVFHYKGNAAEGDKIFRYIFGEWLPVSGYDLDYRPHFEILGEKYSNNSPDSEEVIWIPVR